MENPEASIANRMKNPLSTEVVFSTAFLTATVSHLLFACLLSPHSSRLVHDNQWSPLCASSLGSLPCCILAMCFCPLVNLVPASPKSVIKQSHTWLLCPHSNYYLPHSWRLTLACPFLHLTPPQLLVSLMFLISLYTSLPVSLWPGTKSPCTRVLENLMSRKMSQIPCASITLPMSNLATVMASWMTPASLLPWSSLVVTFFTRYCARSHNLATQKFSGALRAPVAEPPF